MFDCKDDDDDEFDDVVDVKLFASCNKDELDDTIDKFFLPAASFFNTVALFFNFYFLN